MLWYDRTSDGLLGNKEKKLLLKKLTFLFIFCIFSSLGDKIFFFSSFPGRDKGTGTQFSSFKIVFPFLLNINIRKKSKGIIFFLFYFFVYL